MGEPRTEKERAYDSHIAPLMTQIIALCKAHKINMAAQFALGVSSDPDDPEAPDSPLWCTTCLPIDKSDEEGYERTMELRRLMYRQPFFAAFTITSGPGPTP